MSLNLGTIGPLFEHAGDIPFANTVADSFSNQLGTMFVTDTVGNFYQYNLTTFQQIGNTAAAYGSGVTSAAWITSAVLNGASAVCGNQTNTGIVLIELNTGYKQTYTTTWKIPAFSGKSTLMASNPAALVVVCGTNTTGQFAIFNNFSISLFSPAALTGALVCSVCYKDDTATFLLGTNNGQVIEVNSSGTVLKTISLPTTPNAGTAPTHIVTGISYYNGYMLVASALGILYHYNYTTSTVLTIASFNPDGTGQYGAICTGVCGITFISNGETGNGYSIMAVDINASSMISLGIAVTDGTSAFPTFVGFDSSLNRGWIASHDSSHKLRLFDFKNITQWTQDTTRSQNPLGVDIPVKLIRLLTRSPGTTRLDFCQPIAAGQQSITCRKTSTFIEIAVQNYTTMTVGGTPTKEVDIRLTST